MRFFLLFGLWITLGGHAGGASAAPDGALYQCPRHLFTNQIDPAQARLQGCTRVSPGRLTQAVAPTAAAAPVTPPAPGETAVVPVAAAGPAVAPVVTAPAPRVEEPGATATLSAAVPAVALMPVVPPKPATAVAPSRAPDPAGMRVASSRQRARDQDAQAILQSELSRVQQAQRGLQRPGAVAGSTDPVALNRLREDEAALRRELARLNP